MKYYVYDKKDKMNLVVATDDFNDITEYCRDDVFEWFVDDRISTTGECHISSQYLCRCEPTLSELRHDMYTLNQKVDSLQNTLNELLKQIGDM